jgi:hypothetical protein
MCLACEESELWFAYLDHLEREKAAGAERPKAVPQDRPASPFVCEEPSPE